MRFHCPHRGHLLLTGKNFTMDDSFSLGDLLALGLHDFVEEVADIVDKAQKELTIEAQV
eukprot:SAG22_NODE_38_length_26325_cov_107.302067_16_plen_59_part_00